MLQNHESFAVIYTKEVRIMKRIGMPLRYTMLLKYRGIIIKILEKQYAFEVREFLHISIGCSFCSKTVLYK